MTEHQKELAVERLVRRVQQLDEMILETIGKRVAQIGTLSKTEVYQVQQMLKYGADIKKIEKYIAKVTKLNAKDIEDLFEIEARDNYDFAKQFYRARGLEYIPYKKNENLQNYIEAVKKQAVDEYINLSKTIGFTVMDSFGNRQYTLFSRGYQEIIDKAIISLTQGKDTFQNVMSKSLKDLASNGIQVVTKEGIKNINYASGYHRRLDSAVRMNILDGMRMLNNNLQDKFGEDFGADGVEISVHINPAPDHEDVQGKQFTKKEFERLQETGVAKDITGKPYDIRRYITKRQIYSHRPISQMNCYHNAFQIVIGVNKPLYTQQQLNEIKTNNHNGFEYEGKHYSNYEGSQLLRQIETEIRKQKDIQIISRASGDEENTQISQKKITLLTHKYREVVDISGLNNQLKTRAKVSNYRRVARQK